MSTFPCPQLSDLDTALAPLPWSDVKRLAIHLHNNITTSTLDQIEEDRSKVGERRIYCMDVWLKIDCEASWTKLVSALDEIGQNQLARKIESRYCLCLPKPDTRRSMQTRTECPTAQCNAQLGAACLLAPTLRDQESTEGRVVRGYTDNDEIKGVLEQSSNLEERFVSVVTNVQIYLCEKESESSKFLFQFRIKLINLPLSSKYKHMYFLKEKKAVIKAAIDVYEIFEILSPYWNHVDYGLLEYIVNEFAKGNAVQLEMKTYISDLTQFEKGTTVQSYVDAMCDNREIPSEFRDVIIEMGREPAECTLYDIRRFKECLACRASVYAYSIYLKKVGTGCVVVTLAIPNDVMDVFVKVVKDIQLEKDSNILSVSINEETFTSTVLHENESTASVSPADRCLPPPYNPPPPYRRKSVLRRLSHVLKRLLVPRMMTRDHPEYSQESNSDSLFSPETIISHPEYNQQNALPCGYNPDPSHHLHSESRSGLSDADSLSCPPSPVVSSISDKEKRGGSLDAGSLSCPPSPALSTISDKEKRDGTSRHSSKSGKSSRSGRSGRSDHLDLDYEQHHHSSSPHLSSHDDYNCRNSPSFPQDHYSDHQSEHHRNHSNSPRSRSPKVSSHHRMEPLPVSGHQYHSHRELYQPPPAPMRMSRSAELSSSFGLQSSNEADGERKEIIDEVLLMAVGCLMHQEHCQIPNCPCKRVKERFQHILPQTRQHMQKEADQVVEEMQSGHFDPTSHRQQMRISLSSQNFSKDIHAHYHMTSRSHIRTSDGKQKFLQRRRSKSMDLTPVMEQPEPCATTPGVVIPDIARGVLCGPAFSPAVTPAGEAIRVLSPTTPTLNTTTPVVLLREISLSADNLPSLCLNDCPMATTPLMQLGNRPLGSAVKSPLSTNQWSASSSTKPTPVPVPQQKAVPVSIKGRPSERQSGRSEGASVFDDYKTYEAQMSTITEPLEYSIRCQLFEQDEISEIMHVDSGYGETTDGETNLTPPPSDLQLSPPSVPAKQKKSVAKEQPKHSLHPTTNVSKPIIRRGSTSSHGSHTSHLSVGSHISHASDGSITTETLC